MPAEASAGVDLASVRVLLCDADDNLFPSEAPAFAASVEVLNRLLAALGSPRRLDAESARRLGTGKTFRATALELVRGVGRELEDGELEQWVAQERAAVTSHLPEVLRPDPAVRDALGRLAERYELAVVSSSALVRLAACFTATGLDALLPPERRFSAEDSLPRPTSKPDPAVYRLAGNALGITPEQGMAIEDSAAGAASAIGAGFETIGNVCFVPEPERPERVASLVAAGCWTVVESWAELEAQLGPGAAPAG